MTAEIIHRMQGAAATEIGGEPDSRHDVVEETTEWTISTELAASVPT